MKRVLSLTIVVLLFLTVSVGCNINSSNDTDLIGKNTHSISQNPFNELNTHDLSSDNVFAYPPNETVFIDDIERPDIVAEFPEGVYLPKFSLPRSNSGSMSMPYTFFLYQGRVYRNASIYRGNDAAAISGLVGDKVGYVVRQCLRHHRAALEMLERTQCVGGG